MSEVRYQKGDRVGFQYGIRRVQGVVKEDRGPIGIRGRRLYLIEYQPLVEAEEKSLVELPAEDLVAVLANGK